MALLRKARPAPIANTVDVVLPTTKKKAFPTVNRAEETPILIEEIKELPKPTVMKRRPIPKRFVPEVKSKILPTLFPLEEMGKQTILEKINQRQRQIILHSVLYYSMNTNLITDQVFDRWGMELVKLQADYPEITKTSAFYKEMDGFDATTGFHLADNRWGLAKAPYIIAMQKELKGEV